MFKKFYEKIQSILLNRKKGIIYETDILDTVSVDVNTVVELLPQISVTKKYKNRNEVIAMQYYQSKENYTLTIPYIVYTKESGWSKLTDDEIIARTLNTPQFAESLDKILKKHPDWKYGIDTFVGEAHYKYTKGLMFNSV